MILNTNLFSSNQYLLNVVYKAVCLNVLAHRAKLLYDDGMIIEVMFLWVIPHFLT